MFTVKSVLTTVAIFIVRAVIDYVDKQRSKPSS